MKKLQLFVALLLGAFLFSCSNDPYTYALIETDYGNMKVMLYNSTPKHKDNFIKLVKEGYYEDLLFHRVMNEFMIQGGDPNSRLAPEGLRLGAGGPGYRIDPEIGAPHLRGTLAAARDGNPDKKSSGSQFYLVQGRRVDDNFLDNLERQKGIKYNEQQRQLYKEIGGAPFLDNDYTVFGEIVEGLEVVDKIAVVATDGNDRPIEDVKMKIRLVE